MHRIISDTATSDSKFTDGDSSGAIPATDLNADWFNTIQEELVNAVTGSGQALDENNNGQLYGAITRKGLHIAYTETGTYTIPENEKGSTILFCSSSVTSLTLSGTLYQNAYIMVIPMWSASSTTESMNVVYQGETHKVYNGCGMMGFAANGDVDELMMVAVNFPVGSGANFKFKKITTTGDANIGGNVNATGVSSTTANFAVMSSNTVGYDKIIDRSYHALTTDERTDHTWQLMSNWTIGEVKRIYDPDESVSGSTLSVVVYKNSAQGYQSIKMYGPTSFREFLCIGTIDVDGTTYAKLLFSGDNN